MGCCKSKIEGQEINLCYRDVKDEKDEGKVKNEQGFDDISLTSHDEVVEFPNRDDGRCKTFEFFTPNPRSTSISLHKSDLEAAFVQQFQLFSIFPQGKNLD